MDRAKNFYDGQLYEARELLGFEKPRESMWTCPLCGIELIPVACDADRSYKRAPHFRVAEQGIIHDCGIDGPNLAVRGGKKKAAMNEDGMVSRNYSKLYLKPRRVRLPSSSDGSAVVSSNVQSIRKGGVGMGVTDWHDATAGTITPLCTQYVDYPEERWRSLEIPGVVGESYFECFKPCKFLKTDEWVGKKIFIAQIFFGQGYAPENNDGSITVHSYEIFKTEMVQKNMHFTFIIDTTTWTNRSISNVFVGIKKTKDNFDLENKVMPYIFVLAEQDKHRPWLLRCDDYRCICTKAAFPLWARQN